jgi:sortase A
MNLEFQTKAPGFDMPPRLDLKLRVSGPVSDGDVIGRIEIPQLERSVPMMAGYDSSSLLRGVGHIPGTAMPGGLGTLGLAGHRDTYFRPLRRISPNMEIRVIGKTGTYHYVVDSTEIVTPGRVEVLDIQARPTMTLITCYPFDYIGTAPKRFIVHAHLVSAAADNTTSNPS